MCVCVCVCRKVGGSCSRRENEGSERVEVFVNSDM